MSTFRELIESSTIKVNISKLGDDFDNFIDQMKQYGLKDRDWHYDGDSVVLPSKYKKYTFDWSVVLENTL